MESINNDYSPSAFATEVMPSATSQQSLINTYKSRKNHNTATDYRFQWERKLKSHYVGYSLLKPDTLSFG